MSEHKSNNKNKIKKLYRIILATGVIPLVLILSSFVLWLIIDEKSFVNILMFGVMVFTAGFLLINMFFLFLYYDKAKKQHNTQAVSHTVSFICLLLFNMIAAIIFYNYISYAQMTHTIVIDNRSQGLVKKMFLTNGAEKYFILPVEAHDKLSRALQFNPSDNVSYTFDLKGQTYKGALLDDVAATQGKEVKMIIYHEGMVTVNVK